MSWTQDASWLSLVSGRKFVNVHYSLVPYFLTVGSEAMETGTSSLNPLAPHETFIEKDIDDFRPPTLDYLLGKDILVSPIINNSTNTKVNIITVEVAD